MLALLFQVGVLAPLERLGFGDILLWLLVFAILYGILSHVSIPKSSAARAIIAIVAGFLVLMTPGIGRLMTTLTTMMGNLILVVFGLLIFIIFIEVAGVKAIVYQEATDPKTGAKIRQPVTVSIFEKYSKVLAIMLILIAILIFVGAGGLQAMGLKVPWVTGTTSMYGAILLIVIILAVFWMVAERPKKEGE